MRNATVFTSTIPSSLMHDGTDSSRDDDDNGDVDFFLGICFCWQHQDMFPQIPGERRIRTIDKRSCTGLFGNAAGTRSEALSFVRLIWAQRATSSNGILPVAPGWASFPLGHEIIAVEVSFRHTKPADLACLPSSSGVASLIVSGILILI